MALITLLTDFGLQDEYVGVMKGVIAGIAPTVRVVDISHAVYPQDVVHGAFLLAAAYPFFPPGSVHLAVVDPGVGGPRRILAVECGGHRFVAPDNGLLERVLAGQPDARVVAVEKRRYFLDQISDTFHGRDIFAPVGAHMAGGLPLTQLGPVVDRRAVVSGVVPHCRFTDNDGIEGVVVAVDRFGNLLTNIDRGALERLTRRTAAERLVVELVGKWAGALVRAYSHAAAQAPLALVGSRGLVEISVNGGSAQKALKAAIKDHVRVRWR